MRAAQPRTDLSMPPIADCAETARVLSALCRGLLLAEHERGGDIPLQVKRFYSMKFCIQPSVLVYAACSTCQLRSPSLTVIIFSNLPVRATTAQFKREVACGTFYAV